MPPSATVSSTDVDLLRAYDLAIDAFKSAHANTAPIIASQLAPYLKSTIDPSFIEEHLKPRN